MNFHFCMNCSFNDVNIIFFFTLAVVVADIGRRCSHLQSQAIGSLERVAVPD